MAAHPASWNRVSTSRNVMRLGSSPMGLPWLHCNALQTASRIAAPAGMADGTGTVLHKMHVQKPAGSKQAAVVNPAHICKEQKGGGGGAGGGRTYHHVCHWEAHAVPGGRKDLALPADLVHPGAAALLLRPAVRVCNTTAGSIVNFRTLKASTILVQTRVHDRKWQACHVGGHEWEYPRVLNLNCEQSCRCTHPSRSKPSAAHSGKPGRNARLCAKSGPANTFAARNGSYRCLTLEARFRMAA